MAFQFQTTTPQIDEPYHIQQKIAHVMASMIKMSHDRIRVVNHNGLDFSFGYYGQSFEARLKELHNIDYREYRYQQYEKRVRAFLPHLFVTVEVSTLVKALTSAKADYSAGKPNAWSIRLKLANRKADHELMVTLPVEFAGYAIEISFKYLLDLLYILKRQKVKTVKVRIMPLAYGVSSTTRSALEIQNEGSTYRFISESWVVDLI